MQADIHIWFYIRISDSHVLSSFFLSAFLCTQNEKESCFAGFSACGGSHKRHLPLRRSAILAERFYFIGKQFPMKKNRLAGGLTFSVSLPAVQYAAKRNCKIFFISLCPDHPSAQRNISRYKENAQSRNRTSDTRIFSPLLYQLSYLGKSLTRDSFYHTLMGNASISFKIIMQNVTFHTVCAFPAQTVFMSL